MPVINIRYPGLKTSHLRALFSIQERVDVVDALGGFEPQWTEIGKCWGAVTPWLSRKGGEAVAAEELHEVRLYKVILRYTKLTRKITERHRLIQLNVEDPGAQRPLNVQSVFDPDVRRRQIQLTCESGLTSG